MVLDGLGEMLAQGATTEERTFLPLPLGRSETKALPIPEGYSLKKRGGLLETGLASYNGQMTSP